MAQRLDSRTAALSPGLPPSGAVAPSAQGDGVRSEGPRRDPPTKADVTRIVENLELHTEVPPEVSQHGPIPIVPGYAILGVLGEGGMGVVYKARQAGLKRLVALKMIASEHAGATIRQRFQTEAETVARLQHPNIVQIYEVGVQAGRPFLALELVEGGTLAGLLKERTTLPARDAARLVSVLAHAMHHAHQKGVVHRDLKPGNVLLSVGTGQRSAASEKGGEACPEPRDDPRVLPADRELTTTIPKISDFGLAKLLDADQARTRSGTILGTPAYMAPEQASGNGKQVGPPTDIYALGAILYECLTGQTPFAGDSGWDVLMRILHDDPAPPSRLQPRLARDLDTICLTALARDPARRYASAAALADDLDRFAAGEAIAARPESGLHKVGRKLRRRPIAVAACLLVFGALLLGGVVWQHGLNRAEADLAQGRDFARNGAWIEADAAFKRGLRLARWLPDSRALEVDLSRELVACNLRNNAEQLRYNFSLAELDAAGLHRLSEHCQRLWSARALTLSKGEGADPEWNRQVREDLHDIAILEGQLRVRVAAEGTAKRQARVDVLALLDDVEAEFGASPALWHMRQTNLHELGRPGWERIEVPKAQTAAEYQLLGRSYRSAGNLDKAREAFDEGLRRNPGAMSLNYDRGECALQQQRFDDAIEAFTACIALTQNPCKEVAACYNNRALALEERAARAEDPAAGEDRRRALADFDQALHLSPDLSEAHYGRGMFHYRARNFAPAIEDLQSAIRCGYPAAKGYYNLAVVQCEAGKVADALASVGNALRQQPDFRDAQTLKGQLETRLSKLAP